MPTPTNVSSFALAENSPHLFEHHVAGTGQEGLEDEARDRVTDPGELRKQGKYPVDDREEGHDCDHGRQRQRGGSDGAAVVAELMHDPAHEPATVTPCFQPESEHCHTLCFENQITSGLSHSLTAKICSITPRRLSGTITRTLTHKNSAMPFVKHTAGSSAGTTSVGFECAGDESFLPIYGLQSIGAALKQIVDRIRNFFEITQ